MNYSDNFELDKLLNNNWSTLVNKEILIKIQEEINDIINLCKQQNLKIYPQQKNMFYVFNKCKIEDIKVVILGQDPYHRFENQAIGMAFSVSNDISTPPSLRNIHKEVLACYPKQLDLKNDLSSWVDQGVFLLNTSLTVTQNKPGSHIKLWENFTKEILSIISQKGNIVFCLWGKNAETFENLIDTTTNIILKCSHPSPLSAYKTDKPFIGSKIFIKINEYLEKLNKEEINWINFN